MPRKPSTGTITIGPYRIHPRARGGRQEWRILWQEDGRQREHVEHDEDEAKLWAAKHLVRADAAGRPGAALTPDTPMWIVMGAWSDPAHHAGWRSTATVASNVGLMKTWLLPALGQLTARQLAAPAMNRAIEAVRDAGRAQRTVQDVYSVLRSIVRWAHTQGCWDQWAQPLAGVGLPRGVPRLNINEGIDRAHSVPTTRQVTSLVAALQRGPVLSPSLAPSRVLTAQQAATQAALMARLAASSGLRWGELIGLMAGDVGRTKRTLAVRRQIREVEGKIEACFCAACKRYQPYWADDMVSCPACGGPTEDILPKHEKTRTTIFSADLADELVELVEAAAGDRSLLFTPTRGATMRRSSFARHFRTARAASDYPAEMDWHALRHYFCSHMLDRGVRPATVTELAGHHSVTFTLSRYVGADQDYLDEALGA